MFENVTIIQPDPAKSPLLAAVLSLVIPGLGQLYLGQERKGIVILAATIALWCTFIGGPIASIIAVVDAYQIGKKLAAGQVVGDMEWFWQGGK
jgi:TM2 domain-containing membrane protein YozV